MTFAPLLPDVNVLIALVDANHVHHDAAHAWFRGIGASSWATCPVTENGLVRIVGHARYVSGPGTPGSVVKVLTTLCRHKRHVFWPDDLSWRNADCVRPGRLLNSAQVTDTYLLALAVAHGGSLVTFDQKLVTSAVRGGELALTVLH